MCFEGEDVSRPIPIGPIQEPNPSQTPDFFNHINVRERYLETQRCCGCCYNIKTCIYTYKIWSCTLFGVWWYHIDCPRDTTCGPVVSCLPIKLHTYNPKLFLSSNIIYPIHPPLPFLHKTLGNPHINIQAGFKALNPASMHPVEAIKLCAAEMSASHSSPHITALLLKNPSPKTLRYVKCCPKASHWLIIEQYFL